MRIRTKTAILIFVTAFLPTSLLGFVVFSVFQEALTQSVTQRLESTAAVQAARINLILEYQRDLIGQIGSREMLQESLAVYRAKMGVEEQAQVQRNIESILSTIPALRSITLLDLDGAVVATTDSVQTGISYGNARFFRSALTQPVLVSLASTPDKNARLSIRLAGPILQERKTIGIILIQTESGELAAMARDYSGLGETGEIFLAMQDPIRNILTYLTPLRFDPDAMLARRPPPADISNALSTAIIAGQSGFFQNIADYRGRSVLAVVRPIESTPWFLVVKTDREEVFAQIVRIRDLLVLSLLMVMLLIGALSLWISRAITAPILHLEQVVHELDAGNLATRASVVSENELGRLAAAFNRLAERLQHSNQQLRAGLSDLARSNTDLAQFAYAASHDLQEPLRIITSYLALLQRRYQGHLDQNADEFISFVVDAAKRMQRLIHDLLVYSRVGREKTLAPTDLNEAFQDALDNLQAARREAVVEITADPLPTVMARSSEMVQLFQNLLSNAIKFRGERPLEVHVGATGTEDGAEWHLSVRDNGIGIDPKYVDRIFIVFERLHGMGGKYVGSGIGLALCRKIVEQHGGRIWVESTLGQGSTFRFTLPMADKGSEKKASVERKADEDAPVIQGGLTIQSASIWAQDKARGAQSRNVDRHT